MHYKQAADILEQVAASRTGTRASTSAIRKLAAYLRSAYDDLVSARIEIVLNSKSEEARSDAIGRLSLDFAGSNDRAVSAAIAQFLKDEAVSIDLRVIAYVCLFDVAGRPTDEYPDIRAFRFPSDVDWTFVNQFLAEE